jgi:hypothetical protein
VDNEHLDEEWEVSNCSNDVVCANILVVRDDRGCNGDGAVQRVGDGSSAVQRVSRCFLERCDRRGILLEKSQEHLLNVDTARLLPFIGFGKVIECQSGFLCPLPNVASTEQPDQLRGDDGHLDCTAECIHDAEHDVEFILRHECHQREESTAPVDSEKQEVESDDASATLEKLEGYRNEASNEHDEGDDTDGHDRPVDSLCVEWADQEDETCFDSCEDYEESK